MRAVLATSFSLASLESEVYIRSRNENEPSISATVCLTQTKDESLPLWASGRIQKITNIVHLLYKPLATIEIQAPFYDTIILMQELSQVALSSLKYVKALHTTWCIPEAFVDCAQETRKVDDMLHWGYELLEVKQLSLDWSSDTDKWLQAS